MAKKATAVGYVRVSRVGGRGGDSFLSPALQREQIAAVARREGLRVVEVIEELDASGGDSTRPGWNRAIEMVERGEVGGVAVWNLARFSRSVKDALTALERIEDAGGRVWSATEQFGDDPMGQFARNMLLSLGQMERDRARAGFAAATESAVERGIHVAGTIPFGYVRGADRRLRVDPDAAPVVLGIFERRAAGLSWVRIATWAREQGHPMSDTGVREMVRNPVYTGQARYGEVTKDDAHEAIVTRGLFRRCGVTRKPSVRTGRLAGKYLLQGLATCAACGGTLYVSGSGRRVRNPYYICRHIGCEAHAYARAAELDNFVSGVVFDAVEAQGPDGWITVPGDEREVEEAEAALADAREDLGGYLGDTTLRRTLGQERYNEAVADYVAVVNKCDSDLEDARSRYTGRQEILGRLWLQEWRQPERKEFLSRMVKSVVVSKGREPLSRRVEVELR